jgi:hypothetical protein
MRRAALALLFLIALALPVAGADGAAASPSSASLAGDIDWSLPSIKVGETKPGNAPGALPGLYVSLAALNAFDAATTLKGLQAGADEGNPLMRGVVSRSPVLLTVKAATTGASIFLAERLRRNGHKGQAVVMMVLSNSVMATVAAHNARVLSQGR